MGKTRNWVKCKNKLGKNEIMKYIKGNWVI